MSRPAPDQSEFLFGDGLAPQLALPEPLADLVAEMTRLWGLPLYQQTRITLKNHSLDELCGRLELVSAPDLPLNPAQPLSLRVGGVEFSSRHVIAWSLAAP